VDADALVPLCHIAKKMWDQYAPGLKVLAVEDRLTYRIDDRNLLVGHADLICEDLQEPGTVVIWDWKTGSTSREYRQQTRGYAILAQQYWATDRAIRVVTAWVRDAMVDVEDFDPVELAVWVGSVHEALEHPDRYGPSPETCEFCPRAHECDARMARAQADAIVLSDLHNKLETLTPQQLACLKPRADMLKQVLAGYEEALKDAVRKAGSLPTGDGRELYMDRRVRKEIRLGEAWGPLYRAFGILTQDVGELLAAIMPALELHRPKLEYLVSAAAPRGQKGKAREQLMADLEAAGAVVENPFEVLSVRKVQTNGAKTISEAAES
jgi:hypothetical protein